MTDFAFDLVCAALPVRLAAPPACRRLSRPPGALADRLCRRRPGRHRGADHGAVAVGAVSASNSSSKTAPAPAAISRPTPRSTRRPTATRCCSSRPTTRSRPRSTSICRSISSATPCRSRASCRCTNLLVVSNAMPVKTVQEFIDYCKANPGKISFASSGNGTSVHMSAELFKAMTKCDMVHVPYRGSAIAFPDIISNKVQLIFDNLPSALEQARGGTVRALGVTSPQRWPGVPDIPAIAETVPGFEVGRVLRHLGAQGHAARDRRHPQQGRQRGAEGPEAGGAAGRHRRHPEADDAGRIRQAGRRRDREMAQGGGIRRAFRWI